MYHLHALPEKWCTLDYLEFLRERRNRMARVIQQGFKRICED